MHLRPIDIEKDAARLHGVYGDDAACRYLLEPAKQDIDGTIDLLTRYYGADAALNQAILDRPDGPVCGRVAMIPRDDKVYEAAIMLRPDAQGRGLAYRAVAAMLDRVFDQYEARRVYADIDPDNHPSLALFAKLGFTREGVLRATAQTHIGVRDSVFLSLINTDPRPPFTATGADHVTV